MPDKEFIPEKRLFELGIKFLQKVFFLFVALLGYYQSYEYLVDKIPMNVEIINSIKQNDTYETEFVLNNGSSAVEEDDFTKPIKINLTERIQKIVVDFKKQKAIPKFKIENDNIFFQFDLLNKHEKLFFKTFSKNEIQIKSVDFRIKGIDEIDFYHYTKKPKPFKRLTSFWLIVFAVSILLFFDALLLILKDKKLTEMKYLVRDYPLTEKNRYHFLEKYRQLYKEYKVRLKLPESFLIDFKIKNLLDMYDKYNKRDVWFIKFMININTEFSIFYRTRTIFIIISPLLFLTSIIGTILNYIYYNIDFLSNYSLNNLNVYLLKFILIISIIMILFPRRTMNYLFIKRSSRKSENFVGF